MSRLRFVFLGYEIWSIGFVSEPEAEYDSSDEGGAELSIGGGSGMCGHGKPTASSDSKPRH